MMWHVLFVDDDPVICEQVKEHLEGKAYPGPDDRISVTTVSSFAGALEELSRHRVDLVLLDVRRGDEEAPEEEAGIGVLKAIQERRFVPIIFYTNLPQKVAHLETSLVRVLEKEPAFRGLFGAITAILDTGLPGANQALIRHMERVQSQYMWEFVAQHWELLSAEARPGDLAYVLARRLARSLDGPLIQNLIAEMGGTENSAAPDMAHPLQYFIIPPIAGTDPMAGDLYEGTIGDRTGFWAVLTPSCDFPVRGSGRPKVEWVQLARCVPLEDHPEFRSWSEALSTAGGGTPSNPIVKALQNLLTNNRGGYQPERFFFLPGALTLPDLVIDFQQRDRILRSDLDNFARRASLDSPYAEALLARYSRYMGRLGTQDLDVALVLGRLRDRITQVPSAGPHAGEEGKADVVQADDPDSPGHGSDPEHKKA